jgi:small nuclear ribonucleoprotein (snRNP)-like protein
MTFLNRFYAAPKDLCTQFRDLAELVEKKMASIPVRLVHEAKGMQVTVELENGETYTGTLTMIDGSMNMELENATVVDKKGRSRQTDSILIRGSMITFVNLPANLPVAPIVTEAQREAEEDRPPGKAGKRNRS